jgi:hypothetical protein
MILNVDKLPFLVDPLEGMATVPVVVAPSFRGAVITEEHHACMVGFGCKSKKIKKGVIIQQKVLWVSRL